MINIIFPALTLIVKSSTCSRLYGLLKADQCCGESQVVQDMQRQQIQPLQASAVLQTPVCSQQKCDGLSSFPGKLQNFGSGLAVSMSKIGEGTIPRSLIGHLVTNKSSHWLQKSQFNPVAGRTTFAMFWPSFEKYVLLQVTNHARVDGLYHHLTPIS